jgi:hypothetical protein
MLENNEQGSLASEVVNENTISENTASENNATSQAPELSEVENKAYKRGWRPQDQFDGDNDEWVGAKEFLKIRDIQDELRSVKRTNKENDLLLRDMKGIIDKERKLTREKTIQELTQARRNAIENGDVDNAEKISDEILKRREEVLEIEKPAKNEVPPIVVDWVSQHKSDWFNDDTPENLDMMQDAIKYEGFYLHKTGDNQKALELMEQDIRKKYPHRFKNTADDNRNRRSPVEIGAGSVQGVKRKGYDKSQITPELKQIAHAWVRKGQFTSVDEYYDYHFKVSGDK